MLDKEFLQRKVKLIQEDLQKLAQFKATTFAELSKDAVKYSATERYLERIITRAIDINRHVLAEKGTGAESVRTYEETFLRLADLKVYPESFAQEIAPSAGLRNVLVHEYDEVNKQLVYASVGKALAQYTKYCGFIQKLLK